MTAQTTSAEETREDLLLDATDPLDAARQHLAGTALTSGDRHRVGLELELHLVDLRWPARRPTWAEVQGLVAGLPRLPSGSALTLEPGGQLELSTPPGDDVSAAVAALRADRAALSSALAEAGYGGAALGADPVRPVRRVNPHPRYAAMELHFDALGCGRPGRAMMTSTAALQVNLDAGPPAQWRARLDLMRALAPVLVAVSSSSPFLGGRSSGWHSMRQETWQRIDGARSGPMGRGAPEEAWADYALGAPVMLVRQHDRLVPVTERVSFADWLARPAAFGRPAAEADLDYHLTTLFPPVRPRGYVEIRCLDAQPDRWWPALAALTATLVDDPVAADAAQELCTPVAGDVETAARLGTRDPAVAAAVSGCVELAARRAPAGLAPDLHDLSELLASGRTPGDLLRERIRKVGPLRTLEEEARA